MTYNNQYKYVSKILQKQKNQFVAFVDSFSVPVFSTFLLHFTVTIDSHMAKQSEHYSHDIECNDFPVMNADQN